MPKWHCCRALPLCLESMGFYWQRGRGQVVNAASLRNWRHKRLRATGVCAKSITLRTPECVGSLGLSDLRLWWNWQTRYFEVVVGQPVQVQVLLSAPSFDSST